MSLFLEACAQSGATSAVAVTSQFPDTSHLQEVRIDPISVPISKTSSFVDSVTYLPLQTTDKSTFGEISQMEVTKKFYIIWDSATNSILFFTRDGKFFNKITNKDKDLPIPYKEIGGFTVNEQKQQIIVNDHHSQYEYFYTLEGKFIKYDDKKLTSSSFTSFSTIQLHYWNYYLDKRLQSGLVSNNLTVYTNNQKPTGYLPFNSSVIDDTDVYSADQCFYDNHNGVINFTRTYDYNIYAIDSAGRVFNNFRFVLPAINTVPNDFLTSAAYKGNRLDYTKKHTDVLYGITDFYKTDDNIIYRMIGNGYNITCIYNLKSGNQISLSNTISDKLCYMLPFFDHRILALNTDGGLISSIDAGTLFKAKLNLSGNKTWDNALPPSLKAFFKTDNQQNPVLTIMYLKQKI